MKTKFLLKTIHTWIICIIVLLSACQKETSESPLEGLVPVHDTTTMVASEEVAWDTAGGLVMQPRAGLNVNYTIDMTGYKYVDQWITMTQWLDTTKYNTNGYCNYPKYIGTLATKTGGTNMCGPSSFLICLSLVGHDWKVAVPSTDLGKAKRLCEFMKRYQLFQSGYKLGDVTYISNLRDMANGTSTKKGEFTDWGNCNQMKLTATELNVQPKTNTGRTLMKSFIRSHILNDHPVITIISIDPSKKNADNTSYIKTSGGTGHLVVVVGIIEDDANGIYKVRFKDPYARNSKTYVVDYTLFLNSMIAKTTYYNALAFAGQ